VRQSVLAGLRILIVEDTDVVAELLAELLAIDGADVIGPVASLDGAMRLVAEGEPIDGALLDINLAGEHSWPVAEALRRRGVPFVFLSGSSDAEELPPALRSARRLVKPVQHGPLIRAVEEAFRPANV
jgi:CheY-like chemotaxis protein